MVYDLVRRPTWSVVRTFTIADIEELIEVRSALETLAFRRAAALEHRACRQSTRAE